MVYMASWTDESLLHQRPPSEDRGRHRESHAQGPGGPHLRGRDLHLHKRYATKARRGEPLEPGKAPGKPPKIDERIQKLLVEDLEERPFVTLKERCEYVEAISGVSVSRSTMCRSVARIGSTLKKGGQAPRSETSSQERPGG
jgi:transposase